MPSPSLPRNRGYMAIWLANAVSVLGDWLHAMALMILVYELTGSGLVVGVMLASKVLPALLMGAVAGVVADRWNRKWIMIVSDVTRFALVLGFLAVRSPAGVALVVALNMLLASASSFFRPARSATLACIVSKDQLVAANSSLEGASNIAMLVGTLGGGLLAGLIGPYNVFILNAASFLISALALLFVPGGGHVARPAADGGGGGLWRDFVAGVWELAGRPVPLFLVLFYSLWITGVGMSSTVMVVFARDIWGTGSGAVSYLYGAVGGGAIIGALAARPVSSRLRSVPLLITGMGCVGVFDVLFGLSSYIAMGCVLLFLAGIWDGLLTVANDTTLMKVVPHSFLGRVFSAYGALTTTFNIVGMVIGGVVNDLWGGRAVMVGSGSFMMLLVVPALLVAWRAGLGPSIVARGEGGVTHGLLRRFRALP